MLQYDRSSRVDVDRSVRDGSRPRVEKGLNASRRRWSMRQRLVMRIDVVESRWLVRRTNQTVYFRFVLETLLNTEGNQVV